MLLKCRLSFTFLNNFTTNSLRAKQPFLMTSLGVLAAQVIRYVSLDIKIDISLCVAYTAPHEDDVSKHLKEIVIF